MPASLTPMVYLASTLSLATLELLVHIEDIEAIEDMYSVIPVRFDSSLVMRVEEKDLPARWDSLIPRSDTQIFGDRWIEEAPSLVLDVPSAVTFSERNFLLNPAHPDLKKIRKESPFSFRLDPRLIRKGQ